MEYFKKSSQEIETAVENNCDFSGVSKEHLEAFLIKYFLPFFKLWLRDPSETEGSFIFGTLIVKVEMRGKNAMTRIGGGYVTLDYFME